MKKRLSLAALICAVLLTILAPMTALAAGGIDEGRFTDFDNLTWTTWDGVSTTYGRGPKFSDVQPDITDPEYFLKENMLYPGECDSAMNSQGKPKANYPAEVVEELSVFVNSFDWINSDELTRATMVHDRIANGWHGNNYDHSKRVGWGILMDGKGQCGDFSGEFQSLAHYVGLECEIYTPSYLHQACLLKINGQWFATDPTASGTGVPFLSNGETHPIDYEIEYNRYANEVDANIKAKYEAKPEDRLAKAAMMRLKISTGEITVEEYNAMWESGELY